MQISIWQQFSSNHSADFVTVGKFNSPEAAVEAANEVRQLLRRIQTWWQQLPPEELEAWKYKTETSELTPPELEIAADYEIAWPYSLNWFHLEWQLEEPVTVYDRCAFVTAPHAYIWVGPQPFDELLARLGAEVASAVSESKTSSNQAIFCNLSFQQPEHVASDADVLEFEHDVKIKLQASQVHQLQDRWVVDNYIFSPWSSSPHEDLKRILTALDELGCSNVVYSFKTRYIVREHNA